MCKCGHNEAEFDSLFVGEGKKCHTCAQEELIQLSIPETGLDFQLAQAC